VNSFRIHKTPNAKPGRAASDVENMKRLTKIANNDLMHSVIRLLLLLLHVRKYCHNVYRPIRPSRRSFYWIRFTVKNLL